MVHDRPALSLTLRPIDDVCNVSALDSVCALIAIVESLGVITCTRSNHAAQVNFMVNSQGQLDVKVRDCNDRMGLGTPACARPTYRLTHVWPCQEHKLMPRTRLDR